MKQLLLLIAFTFIGLSVSAQLCVADSLYRDSSAGVYPPPRNDRNPDGGINSPACVNKDFEFVFTFKVPSSFTFAGATLGLDSIKVDTSDRMSVTGLPEGIEWACNPPKCVFDPIVDSLGCLVLYGAPTDNNALTDYSLEIKTTVYTSFTALNLTFPNSTIENADGDYTITLLEEGNTACNPLSTQDVFDSRFSVNVSPNPFSYFSNIEIVSETDELLLITVSDLLGQQVHTEQFRVFNGRNVHEFDGSNLSSGIYIYTIANEYGKISKKMMIQR